MQRIAFKCEERLVLRANLCLERMMKSPQASFPDIFVDSAELQGFYRLVNNDNFSVDQLVDGVGQEAIAKVPDNIKEVLSLHDTTDVVPRVFSEDFGPLTSEQKRGFRAHVSLLCDLGATPTVYGIGDVHFWSRSIQKKECDSLESARWFDQVQSVETKYLDHNIIHVMDREADSYEIISKLLSSERRFVIRLAHNRLIKDDQFSHLFESLSAAEIIAEREVKLSKRRSSPFFKANKIHPPRKNRASVLKVSAKSVEFKLSGWLKRQGKDVDLPESIRVNVVRVIEASTPEGEKPIQWLLVTSEPIDKPEAILKIVDIYRRRWLIEEFFKALKTGCQLEQRLLSSFESWSKMICLFMPIAVTLMNLRNLEALSIAETEVLNDTQLEILTKLASKGRRPLATVRDVKYEIAKLGGYIRTSGPPGWQILARGYKKLLLMEVGWNLQRDM